MGTPADPGRRAHYGAFHGLTPVPAPDGRPLLVVHGNCQAESLRVLLGDGVDAAFRTVRLPPVHELTAPELPDLHRVLAAADVLVSQPVRADFRGLALGTAQVRRALPAHAKLVLVPVLRFAGLHPFAAIVRAAGAGGPPVAPYHDLRTLVEAVGRPRRESATATQYRALRELSLAALREREERHGAVLAHDLFAAAGREAAHIVNHPGNVVLRGVAERVRAAAGHPGEVRDPGRVLLGSVLAPVRADVLAATGVPGEAREDWCLQGRAVSDAEVREAHLRWYAERPDVAAVGLRRHADALDVLGLG